MKKIIILCLAIFMVFNSLSFKRVKAVEEIELVPLSQTIEITKGQLMPDTCEIVESEIYGSIVHYELKKGHSLSISDSNYVFSVRQYVNGEYQTMLKSATSKSYVAKEDMVVACLIRKPNKSSLTQEEINNLYLIDSQYNMKNVEGYAQRFTVEATTIDGSTDTTRAVLFLPTSYDENGEQTKLVMMTHGYSGYLSDSAWYGNKDYNIALIQNYLNAGYAVFNVDNTKHKAGSVADVGCPQMVDSYYQAYQHIIENYNVEDKIYIHSRSFGTFSAVRFMRLHPEIVHCAVMTGPRVNVKLGYNADRSHFASRFGFDDQSGKTYEADKVVGYDPYSDITKEENYSLPPTFWMLSLGDETTNPEVYIERLENHGNEVISKIYTDTDHSGVCSLNSEEMFNDAIAYFESFPILKLLYDDHYDIKEKNVEIIDAGTPTSYQVGYGVERGTLNECVVSIEGSDLVATGIGSAVVKIDDVVYNVEVETAPISLLLIIGQSNAEGMEGSANQSIICEEGQVYSTYAKSNGLTGDAGLTVENANKYVPSALTGIYSSVNKIGTSEKLSGHPIHSLNESGQGKYGMDSGLAYEWNQQTGEKVWVVNAAHGGTSISTWQKGKDNYEQAVALFKHCQDTLVKEIQAGHYTLSHMGYYWCQGCADETRTASWYIEQYLAMHENLKKDLIFEETNQGLEFSNIVLVQAGHATAKGYRQGIHNDTAENFFMTFKELEMRGPRVAQIWMANNPNLKDIHLVSTLGNEWVTLPDGSDGVEEYFNTYYENGKVDYTTQVKQKEGWYQPTTPSDVKDSIHYNQIGYNEVGRESARNTLYILEVKEKPEIETTVTFYDWTGYQKVEEISSLSTANSDTLVVPLVYPLYESKNVTYSVSEGLSYDFYDLLDVEGSGGALFASVESTPLKVIERESCCYRFELSENTLTNITNNHFHENKIIEMSSSDVYQLQNPVMLRHNKAWMVQFYVESPERFMALAASTSSNEGDFYIFKSKSGSGVVAVGEKKDGKYQNYGIKQSEVAIDWTKPHTYTFKNVLNEDGTNTIYLLIDNQVVSDLSTLIVNDVVQTRESDYLVGKDFVFSSIGCSGFALNTHQMQWLEICEDTNKQPTRIGDVNHDGQVNHQDRMMLTRYLAKWSGYEDIDLKASDVNMDGKVNPEDRMILTRYLAKWSGYESLPYQK